jgi:hypothetical protein
MKKGVFMKDNSINCMIIKKSKINEIKNIMNLDNYIFRNSLNGLTVCSEEYIRNYIYDFYKNIDIIYNFYKKYTLNPDLEVYKDPKYKPLFEYINNFKHIFKNFDNNKTKRSFKRTILASSKKISREYDFRKIKKLNNKSITLTNKIILVKYNDNLLDIVNSDELNSYVNQKKLIIEEYNLEKNILKLKHI